MPATRSHHALTGNIQVLENCPNVTSVNFSACFSIDGKFEDFKALGALLELNICCSNIDCKNALEVLPTMPWAGQIQKLDLSYTDAEGTKNIRKFAHQSAF